MEDSCVNCEAGRKIGCGTFCCQLLVRLTEEEAQRLYPDRPSARFLEKAADGFCLYLDRATSRCKIWEKRPSICRGYDCNGDTLLQVAVTKGVRSIVELAAMAQRLYLPRHLWVTVPTETAEAPGSGPEDNSKKSHQKT